MNKSWEIYPKTCQSVSDVKQEKTLSKEKTAKRFGASMLVGILPWCDTPTSSEQSARARDASFGFTRITSHLMSSFIFLLRLDIFRHAENTLRWKLNIVILNDIDDNCRLYTE